VSVGGVGTLVAGQLHFLCKEESLLMLTQEMLTMLL